MASLSKQLEAGMAVKLADHAFGEKIKVAYQAVTAAGDELYVHVFGAENIKLMNSLPNGFIEKTRLFFVNLNGDVRNVDIANDRPIPRHAASAYREIPVVNIADEPVRKYVAASREYDSLKRQRSEARSRAEAAMANINTFGQLWKLWPEAKSVIGHFEQKPERALLPAVVINDLNKELGLPAGGEK